MSNNEQLISSVHLTHFSSKNVFSVFRAVLFRFPLRFLLRVLSTPLFERDYTFIRRGPPFLTGSLRDLQRVKHLILLL